MIRLVSNGSTKNKIEKPSGVPGVIGVRSLPTQKQEHQMVEQHSFPGVPAAKRNLLMGSLNKFPENQPSEYRIADPRSILIA
jgi:hypothetical protein